MRLSDTTWSGWQIELATRMNEEGMRSTAIGIAIGKSRSAVIGFFRRSGISLKHARGNPGKPAGPKRPRPQRMFRPKPLFVIPPKELVLEPTPRLDLTKAIWLRCS